MSSSPRILSIDQGTTSSRAIVFKPDSSIASLFQQEFAQYYPENGWVEHDPEEIWQSTLAVCRNAISKQSSTNDIVAIGITNQRETSIVWDRETGKPIYNAIVWQDRRAADKCDALRKEGYDALISQKTGLRLDPYFSASKISWILEQIPDARSKAESGKLAFGTVDSFLIWRLTSGKVHATDASNASRTMLFNIHTFEWDDDLLKIFNIPRSMLPDVFESAADFGTTEPEFFGRAIPISGVAGDQQSAMIGQACFEPGMLKSTYGTGCFALLNTGNKALASNERLLTTIAYRLNGKTTYALEGSIFVAGAAIQWLRDGMKIINSAEETELLAKSLQSNNGVYIVPAFTGLGAPHWDPHARGTIFGLTRDTGTAELVRATLESICYQSFDLLQSMTNDGQRPSTVRIDGGMVKNNWMNGFLADILGIPVERPIITETTALGAAYLAGLQTGLYLSIDDLKESWQCEKRFEPHMPEKQKNALLDDWNRAVNAVLQFHSNLTY